MSIKKEQFASVVTDLTNELAETLIRKNMDYGNSFSKLYQEFGETCVAIRLTDKLERYKNLLKNDPRVTDESKEDTLLDFAGYAILALAEKRING